MNPSGVLAPLAIAGVALPLSAWLAYLWFLALIHRRDGSTAGFRDVAEAVRAFRGIFRRRQ